MIRKLLILAAVLVLITGCSGNNKASSEAASLYGTWVTDLGPLGHEGYSHSTFNDDGTYTLDMEFVVAGSDCFLDVTTTGTFVATATTLTITHKSGTQAVSKCSTVTYNQEKHSMTQAELDSYNTTKQMMWKVDGDVLKLTDGGDLNRTYTRLKQ